MKLPTKLAKKKLLPSSHQIHFSLTRQYKFKISDAVWGKMKGFPAWPGVISMPTDNMKRPAVKSAMHCVRFFGTNDFAWIQEHDIKPYAEFRDKLLGTKKKSKAMIKAVQEIEAHLKSKGTNLPELPNIPAASDLSDSKAGAEADDPDEADAEFDALLRCEQQTHFFSSEFILDISA